MENVKPLKRNVYIIPFSREHHGALLFCWKIRWGIHLNVSLQRIRRYVQWFWENYLKPHQDEEGKLLFFDHTDTLVQKALDEHAALSENFEDIITGSKQDNAHFLALVDFLEEHTRYEERILFPHLENELSGPQLVQIGRVLYEESRNRTAGEDYDDEFWKR
ncbi:MAG: hypothetical protein QM594_03820 [Niabella sp.]